MKMAERFREDIYGFRESIIRSVWFDRSGNHVYLEGVWLGVNPEVLFENGEYQVWYVKSHKCWSGLACPWVDEPASYYVVRIEGERAFFLGVIWPGVFWAKARRVLQEYLLELAGGEMVQSVER